MNFLNAYEELKKTIKDYSLNQKYKNYNYNDIIELFIKDLDNIKECIQQQY